MNKQCVCASVARANASSLAKFSKKCKDGAHAAEGDQLTFDGWIWPLLSFEVGSWLESATFDDLDVFEETLQQWSTKFEQAVQCFNQMADGHESLKTVTQDCWALTTIFNCAAAHGGDDRSMVPPVDARNALHRMKNCRSLKSLSRSMDSPCGKELLLRLHTLVKASAQDEAGNKLLRQAVLTLQDKDVLHAVREERDGVRELSVMNCGYSSLAITMEAFFENLTSIMEAYQHWSPPAAEAAESQVIEWVKEVSDRLVLYDYSETAKYALAWDREVKRHVPAVDAIVDVDKEGKSDPVADGAAEEAEEEAKPPDEDEEAEDSASVKNNDDGDGDDEVGGDEDAPMNGSETPPAGEEGEKEQEEGGDCVPMNVDGDDAGDDAIQTPMDFAKVTEHFQADEAVRVEENVSHFVTAMRNQFGAIKGKILDVDAFDPVSVLLADLTRHGHVRRNVASFLMEMTVFSSSCSALPDPATAVEEWSTLVAKKTAAEVSASFLQRALHVRELAENIKKYGAKLDRTSLGDKKDIPLRITIPVMDGNDAVTGTVDLQLAEAFPETLLNMPIMLKVADFLQQCVGCITQAVATDLRLESLRVPDSIPDELSSEQFLALEMTDLAGRFQSALESLVILDNFPDTVFDGMRGLRPGAATDLKSKAADMTETLKTLTSGAEELDLSPFAHTKCVLPVESAVGLIMEVFCKAQRLSICIACLAKESKDMNSLCPTSLGKRLAPIVKVAMELMINTKMPDWTSVQKHMDAADALPWIVPLRTLRKWFDSFQGILPQVKKLLLKFVSSSLMTAAGETVSSLPVFEHYLNDTVFNKGLARKHLLSKNVRSKISDSLKNVQSMNTSLRELFSTWSLGASITTDVLFADDVTSIDGVLASIRKSGAVVAAVSVCLEYKGVQQAEHALSLLETRMQHLTKSLVAALEELSSGAAATAKRKAEVQDPIPIEQQSREVKKMKRETTAKQAA